MNLLSISSPNRWFMALILVLFLGGTSEAQVVQRTQPTRFIENTDIVIDQETGLQWRRCSLGQQWIKGACYGSVAIFLRRELPTTVPEGWAIPTIDELVSLVDVSRKASNRPPTIDEKIFPAMDPERLLYWTDSPYDGTHCTYIYFRTGSPVYLNCGPAAVLLVKRKK